MSALRHGGDLAAFGQAHPSALRPLIDLSTGINPHAYELAIDQDWMQRLPGAADEEACRAAFAAYAGVDRSLVHLMPGTQSIISGLPHLFDRAHVSILSPTYGEHEASWRAAGHSVSLCSPEEILGADADVIVITHPNNPDGHVFEAAQLRACQSRQKARGCWLVVDEAFIDCSPELSMSSEVQKGGLLVLRSFGKFFGLAGLRLGFFIGPAEMADQMTRQMGPWSVSTPALCIGAEAYGDAGWISETRQALTKKMDRLQEIVAPRLGVITGGTPLFVLLKTPDAAAAATHLGRHGIFVRTFADMPDCLRIGLPGEPWAWDRLETALTEWERRHEC